MPHLILIKHAAPEVVPAVPSERWQLSERGRQGCRPLAAKVAPYQPFLLVCSDEPKAAETAQLVAQHLGTSAATVPGLHEHDRSNVPHMRSAEFISTMEAFFRQPTAPILGRETAAEALARFSAAIDDLLAEHPDQNLAVISHGTVIALFLAKHTGQPAFQLWRKMGLPSYAVLSRPSFDLVEMVWRID